MICKKKKRHGTTPVVYQLKQRVRITHPFHPKTGQEFDLVSYRRSWGKECVDCQDEKGRQLSFPIAWTDLAEPDPFVVIGRGRPYFRVEDLIRLADLIEGLDL